MFDKKQIILEILNELIWVWDLSEWLKNLIILSNDEDLINSVYEIIKYSINQTKNNIEINKLKIIEEKMQKIQKEEYLEKENAETFLEENLNLI